MMNFKRKALGHKFEASAVVAFVSTYGAAISAAVTAVSAISSAQQQKDAANYNAKVAENQAIASRNQAAANAEMQRRSSQRQIGKMEATYAASGVTMEGSPMEILEQSAREAELDRMNIIYSGEMGATGAQNTAALERSRASNAMTSGYMSAAGSLFSSAGKSGFSLTRQ